MLPDDNEIKEPKLKRSWHDAYIDFQADPTDNRNDKEWCESIPGLEYGTFTQWKGKYRKYIFHEVELRRNTFRNELRTKAYKALTKKLDKDTNAVKLLFQLLGDLVERTESRVEMSDADKVKRVENLLREINKKQSKWDEASPSPQGPGPEAQEPGGAD